MTQEHGLVKLIKELRVHKKTISLETNGSYSLTGIPFYVKRVIDVKTPSTGCAGSFKRAILKTLRAKDEIKFVISDKADYSFAKTFLQENRLAAKAGRIIFSPCLSTTKKGRTDISSASKLAGWILKDRLEVVFGPQLHKLVPERPIRLA